MTAMFVPIWAQSFRNTIAVTVPDESLLAHASVIDATLTALTRSRSRVLARRLASVAASGVFLVGAASTTTTAMTTMGTATFVWKHATAEVV